MNRAHFIPIAILIGLSGCYGEGREPGDDPTRSDEPPTEGRPKTDPMQEREPTDPSGGGDAPNESARVPEQARGTLDGPSDEVVAPADPAR